MKKNTYIQFLVGIVAAIVFIFILRQFPDYDKEIIAIVVSFCGGVYFGMGMAIKETKKIVIQVAMSLVFFVLAFLGLWLHPLFAALGFFIHGTWDMFIPHKRGLNIPILNWYVPMCVGFDYLAGITLVVWYFM